MRKQSLGGSVIGAPSARVKSRSLGCRRYLRQGSASVVNASLNSTASLSCRVETDLTSWSHLDADTQFANRALDVSYFASLLSCSNSVSLQPRLLQALACTATVPSLLPVRFSSAPSVAMGVVTVGGLLLAGMIGDLGSVVRRVRGMFLGAREFSGRQFSEACDCAEFSSLACLAGMAKERFRALSFRTENRSTASWDLVFSRCGGDLWRDWEFWAKPEPP